MKLPGYEEQVAPAVGGVQPGNLYSPNVHLESGWAAAFSKASDAALTATGVLSRLEAEQNRKANQVAMYNFLGEVYKGSSEIKTEMATTDPWQVKDTANQRFTELHDNLIQNVPEALRPLATARYNEIVAHTYGAVNAHAVERQNSQMLGQIMGTNNQLIDLYGKATDPKQQEQIMNQVTAMFDGGGLAQYGMNGPQIEALKQDTLHKMRVSAFTNMAANPGAYNMTAPQMYEKLRDPNFMPELKPEERWAAMEKGHSGMVKLWEDNRNNLQQEFLPIANSTTPVPKEMIDGFLAKVYRMGAAKEIPPAVVDQYEALAKGALAGGNQKNPQNHFNIGQRVLDDNNPISRKEFLDGIKNGTSGYQMSYDEAMNILDRIDRRDKGDSSYMSKTEHAINQTYQTILKKDYQKYASDLLIAKNDPQWKGWDSNEETLRRMCAAVANRYLLKVQDRIQKRNAAQDAADAANKNPKPGVIGGWLNSFRNWQKGAAQ